MLTIQCRKVLSKLKRLTGNTNAEFCYLYDEPGFCLSQDMERKCNCPEYAEELNSIMEHLISEGYAKNTFNEFHFRLTQKSIHIRQVRLDALRFYLLEKWISIIALIISACALLKSYGYGIDDIFNACRQLLGK